MKDVGLRIRVQRHLRDAFLEACRADDRPAAQVLREFMREYVRERSQADSTDNDAATDGAPHRGDQESRRGSLRKPINE